jgi:CheY-like chemotaxis protein
MRGRTSASILPVEPAESSRGGAAGRTAPVREHDDYLEATPVTDRVFAGGLDAGTEGSRLLADGAVPLRSTGDPVRVLVVDDSAVFRRGLVRAVQVHAGLELVGEAASGAAALGAIARLHPDVVLLDLRMPDLDGLAVLDLLRDAEPPPSCRVVIVSASLDEGTERAARAAGAVACIGKHRSRADICAAALRVARQ